MTFNLTYSDPIEIILDTILKHYFATCYCIVLISERILNFNVPKSFVHLIPDQDLYNKLLKVSDFGCNDYVIRMSDVNKFAAILEKVNRAEKVRQSNKKVIFLPPFFDTDVLRSVQKHKITQSIANLLIVYESIEAYELITHSFVGKNQKNKVLLDTWSKKNEKFVRNANLFPHDIANMLGKVVKVACFHYKPFTVLGVDKNKTANGRDGIDMRVIDEFCRWINCTIEIVRDDTHAWGAIDAANGTGVGVMGAIYENRADFGITSVASWHEAHKYIDFSVYIVRGAITVIVPVPIKPLRWSLPVAPLGWSVWLALNISMLFACIVLRATLGYDTAKTFIIVLGIAVGQSQPHQQRLSNWRTRRITAWLLISASALTAAFSGALSASLTAAEKDSAPDTVKEMAERNVRWGAVSPAYVYSLLPSEDPILQKIVRLFNAYSPEELTKRSFKKNMAFGVETIETGYYALGEHLTEPALRSYRLISEELYYDWDVVYVKKSGPYLDKLNQFLGRLHESGIILAWNTQVAMKYMDYKVQLSVKYSRNRNAPKTAPLTYHHFVGAFALLLVGVGISTIILCIEIFYNKMYGK